MSTSDHADLICRLLTDDDLVALCYSQKLDPADGPGTPFFPPTYLGSDNEPTYCISALGGGGRNLCTVDSVQSQANRMEEALLTSPYRSLTRSVSVEAELADGSTKTLDVLQMGHRAADAALMFSTLREEARAAIRAWRTDCAPLARFSPMSLLCGMWDSRPGGSQLKIPRAFSASITARDVAELRRMATFTGSFWSKDLGLDGQSHAAEGIDPVPAGEAKGGVIAGGDITRRATLNLVALRQNCLHAGSAAPTLAARYVTALGLVAMSMPATTFLRQGCLLVASGQASWELVDRHGQRTALRLDAKEALAWAHDEARAFGIHDLPALHGQFQKEALGKDAEPKTKPKQSRAAKTGN